MKPGDKCYITHPHDIAIIGGDPVKLLRNSILAGKKTWFILTNENREWEVYEHDLKLVRTPKSHLPKWMIS